MPESIPGIPELPITAATEPIPAAPEEVVEVGKTGVATAPAEARRKRHRRSKAELEAAKAAAAPPTPPVGASNEDLERCRLGFAMLFGLVDKMLTKKWGEDMALTEEEISTLAGAWTEAVAPYLPKMGSQMPLATAAVATLLIALPRWDTYQAYKAAHALDPAGV